MTTHPTTHHQGEHPLTTDTTPHLDTRPVTVPLWALDRILSLVAAGNWSRTDRPELGEAWDEVIRAKDAALGREPAAVQAPPLPVLEIRSRDGQVVAEVTPGPDGRFVVHLPVYCDDRELPALPAGEDDGYYRENYFEDVPKPGDEQHTDAFTGGADHSDGMLR